MIVVPAADAFEEDGVKGAGAMKGADAEFFRDGVEGENAFVIAGVALRKK